MINHESLNPLKLVTKVIPKQGGKPYSAKIQIYLEKKNYIIKTADNIHELNQALRLRHDVFIKEQLKKEKRSGLDKDHFDRRCDHLLIIEIHSGKLIGTYRMQSSLHTRKWYTATEFHMRHIRKLPGNKLELGRACVHPDFRNGITISMLWEGIHAYMLASDTRYMFGCSSIKTMNKDEIKQLYYYLKHHNYLTDEHKVRPRGKFRIHGLHRHFKKHPQVHNLDMTEIRKKIPSLLHSYLRAGAKVCGNPALDKSFNCIDFLTLLDVTDLREQYSRKMKSQESLTSG